MILKAGYYKFNKSILFPVLAIYILDSYQTTDIPIITSLINKLKCAVFTNMYSMRSTEQVFIEWN